MRRRSWSRSSKRVPETGWAGGRVGPGAHETAIYRLPRRDSALTTNKRAAMSLLCPRYTVIASFMTFDRISCICVGERNETDKPIQYNNLI